MINVQDYMTKEEVISKRVDDTPQSEWRDLYISKLISCYLQMGYDQEDMIGELTYCLNWLDRTDFFLAPASIKYHDSRTNGLLYHSLLVADKIVELTNIPSFRMIKPHEAVLVALTHDWCKIGLYEMYEKNVKDTMGNWVKEPAYRWRENPLMTFGHSVSSMTLAQRFFRFSDEMLLAIRWHMGWTRVCDEERVELTNAENHYPLVNMIEFADKLAVAEYKE